MSRASVLTAYVQESAAAPVLLIGDTASARARARFTIDSSNFDSEIGRAHV